MNEEPTPIFDALAAEQQISASTEVDDRRPSPATESAGNEGSGQG
jgi:hypothetical protein